MKDGIYQVTTKYLCAGFIVKNGEVTTCAPILKRKIEYWKTIAKQIKPMTILLKCLQHMSRCTKDNVYSAYSEGDILAINCDDNGYTYYLPQCVAKPEFFLVVDADVLQVNTFMEFEILLCEDLATTS